MTKARAELRPRAVLGSPQELFIGYSALYARFVDGVQAFYALGDD
jgi:hypothetical protein